MRIALFLLLCTLLLPLRGQEYDSTFPAKSELTLGGSIGGNRTQFETRESRSNQFSIQPYVLLQLSPHWQIGLNGLYARSRIEEQITVFNPSVPSTQTFMESRTSRQIGYGIFGRYTFNPQRQFNFFIQPGIGLTNDKFEAGNDLVGPFSSFTTNLNRILIIGVVPGVSYRFSPHWRASLFSGTIGHGINWSKPDQAQSFELSNTNWFYNLNLSSLRFAVEFTL